MPDHVLVVEDDRDLAEAIATILTTYGYQAEVAHDGREALAAVAVRMPALIILDMLMPNMDGWEFARELDARHGRAAPIVVASASENARRRATEISAEGVLPKPFELQQLLELVARFVGRPPIRLPVKP
jgi:DNA-binding response OmpR family regulator